MEEQKYADGQTIEVSLESIELDENQPRKTIDEDALNALANSIKRDGIIQNIAVRPVEDGKFKIVAGERRYRAFKKLCEEDAEKWGRINVVIRLVDDKDALNLAVIENEIREALLPIERAEAIDRYQKRAGIKQDKKLADALGMSKGNLSNIKKLLELDDYIKQEASGENGKKYAFRELLKLARLKGDARKRAFTKLKEKVTKPAKGTNAEDGTNVAKEVIPYTAEEEALNSKRFFARTAKELGTLADKDVEVFEANKFNAAETILNALKCLGKLSEVKDFPIDLKQISSIKEMKEELQKVVDANRKAESELKPEPKPKKEKASAKKGKGKEDK